MHGICESGLPELCDPGIFAAPRGRPRPGGTFFAPRDPRDPRLGLGHPWLSRCLRVQSRLDPHARSDPAPGRAFRVVRARKGGLSCSTPELRVSGSSCGGGPMRTIAGMDRIRALPCCGRAVVLALPAAGGGSEPGESGGRTRRRPSGLFD